MSAASPRFGSDASISRRVVLARSSVLGLGALAASRLGPVAAQDGSPAADTYPALILTAYEYAFEGPATAESGYTRLTLDNQGGEDHHAIFFRFGDGTTQDQFMAALMTGDLGALMQLGASYGGPMASANSQASVIASLDPGTYAVICLIPDPEGVPHVAHGMVSMLEVTEGTSTAPDPVADGVITMVEMTFDGLPAEVTAGMHMWEVTNGGTQLHEMGILQLVPGVPAEAVIASMMAPPMEASPAAVAAATPVTEGPPPFLALFGAAPMNPGATNYVEFNAQPGEYIAICFVPDPATGMPHFLMGMVASFVVV